MKAPVDESVVLAALEELASKLGFHLIYAEFEESDLPIRGGRCRLKGKELILMDRSTAPRERIELSKTVLLRQKLEVAEMEDIEGKVEELGG